LTLLLINLVLERLDPFYWGHVAGFEVIGVSWK